MTQPGNICHILKEFLINNRNCQLCDKIRRTFILIGYFGKRKKLFGKDERGLEDIYLVFYLL